MSRLLSKAILLVSMLFASAVALQAGIPAPPQPPRLVNDLCPVFSREFTDSLERALVAFDDSTSNQLCVVTVSDLEGREVADYALRLANEWGIGSSKNNGVLILLKPRGSDGYVDVTIQVGRGLEGAVPDAYASRIIRNLMGPHLRSDEYQPAVSKACEELMALASGEISQPRDGAGDADPGDAVAALVIFLLFILLIILAAKKSHGKGGGHSGHGGHFGGGPTIMPGSFGGSSGSFGCRGGFGGFGGGSFGGGGASGRF